MKFFWSLLHTNRGAGNSPTVTGDDITLREHTQDGGQYNMLLPERTFYRFKFEVARTMAGSCDPNGLVGENVWNVERLRPNTMIEFVVNRR